METYDDRIVERRIMDGRRDQDNKKYREEHEKRIVRFANKDASF